MKQSHHLGRIRGLVAAGPVVLGLLFQPEHTLSNDDPPPELEITAVVVNLGDNTITINGQNFDYLDPDYAKPLVLLDDFELRVLSNDAIVITASLDALPAPLLGNHLVAVETGESPQQYDDHCFAIDEAGQQSTCDYEPPDESWVQWDRVSIRHVPKGPPGAETDETDLFTWKAGPAKINSKKNKWGDPEFFQLLEDYTIDLGLILDSYPDELGRCDDGWWLDNQRSNLIDRLNDDNCLEWREDDEHAVCTPEHDTDPEGGYFLLKDGKLTIKRGYRWDGASMVSPFDADKRVYPKTAALMRSTCVHDTFYDYLRMGIVDNLEGRIMFRKLGDCLLYMLSRQDGYVETKARVNFSIVRELGTLRSYDDMPSWKWHAVAHAGHDQHIPCAPPEGAEVTLDSTGTKFASASRTWKENGAEIPGTADVVQPTVLLSPGVHRIHLYVEDTDPNTDWLHDDSDDVVITVHQDSEPPVVIDSPDIDDVPNEPGVCGAHVEFSVGADDNCGCPEIECTPASGSWFDVGTTSVTCTATDAAGNISAAVDFDVTVEDTEPPRIDGIPHPLTMWPPNHLYRTFAATDFVTSLDDNCTAPSALDVVIREVTSDEPEDVAGGGDGNTLYDILIAADRRSVQLRSERLRGGNGRVYTVHLEVADGSGNVATAAFQVHVAHERHAEAVDDGPAYSVSDSQKRRQRSSPNSGRRLP